MRRGETDQKWNCGNKSDVKSLIWKPFHHSICKTTAAHSLPLSALHTLVVQVVLIVLVRLVLVLVLLLVQAYYTALHLILCSPSPHTCASQKKGALREVRSTYNIIEGVQVGRQQQQQQQQVVGRQQEIQESLRLSIKCAAQKAPPRHKLVQRIARVQYVDVFKLHRCHHRGSSVVQFSMRSNAGAVSTPRAATGTLSQTKQHTLAPLSLSLTCPYFHLLSVSHPDFTYSYYLQYL